MILFNNCFKMLLTLDLCLHHYLKQINRYSAMILLFQIIGLRKIKGASNNNRCVIGRSRMFKLKMLKSTII